VVLALKVALKVMVWWMLCMTQFPERHYYFEAQLIVAIAEDLMSQD
jgi:hypothetical protein